MRHVGHVIFASSRVNFPTREIWCGVSRGTKPDYLLRVPRALSRDLALVHAPLLQAASELNEDGQLVARYITLQ